VTIGRDRALRPVFQSGDDSPAFRWFEMGAAAAAKGSAIWRNQVFELERGSCSCPGDQEFALGRLPPASQTIA